MASSHICALGKTPERFDFSFVGLFQVWRGNPSCKKFFRSIASIEKERSRHKATRNHCLIHPLSKFRIFWETLLLTLLFASLVWAPLLCVTGYIQPEYEPLQLLQVIDTLVCVMYMFDIALTFCTGYSKPYKKEITLNLGLIKRMYIRSYEFYVDIISCIPTYLIFFIITRMFPSTIKYYQRVELVSYISVFRVKRFKKYLQNTLEFIRHLYYYHILINYSILTILSLHWLTCVYMTVFFINMKIDVTENIYIKGIYLSPVESYEEAFIYVKSFYAVVANLLGVSLVNGFQTSEYFNMNDSNKTVLLIVYSFLGWVLCNIMLVIILQIVMSKNACRTKYSEILSQLSVYMAYKDLPHSMKNRIMTYYEYKFRHKYFREATILNMLSETLRREIYLHSCRSLIENVSILKELPADTISQLVTNLKHEVFLYNDIIVKAGSFGDCMYFIANGTVAVTTPTGKEICHLQDGAYFGEIALLFENPERVANVIAIEICEIYRLDRRHFLGCFPMNSLVYRKMEQLAQERMEKTVLLEELYKKYMTEKVSKHAQ